MESKAPPRILVIRGGAIGDFVLTLPAVRLLRTNFPGCHLEILGYPGIVDLAIKAGLADAVRSLEHRTMAPLFAKGAAIDEELQDYLRSFNVVISYLYDPDGHFRASLERVGVKTLIEGTHRLEAGAGHAAQQLAKPLESLALYLEEPDWRLPLFAKERMPPACPPMRVAIHPGSGSTRKNWPLAHWRELLLRLSEGGIRCAVITGEAEADRGVTAEIQRDWPALSYELWESLPLPELADRFSQCDLFVGHDSGISHLASACGVPCFLLFGPTDSVVWAPPQGSVQVIQAPEGDSEELDCAAVWARISAVLG